MSPHPHVHTSPEPCSSYPMPRAELGFDGSRSGYILNPPKPNKYPPNTHRYLVPASLIGGSLWGVRNPDQCPHLHYWTPIDKVARVPATPTGRPRLPRHPSGGKWDKELAWRPGGTGMSSGWLTPPPWRGLSRPPTPVPVLLSIAAGLAEPRRHGTWEGR